jgi:DNA-directed RNA polymerase subunit RPC12/RpoP
MTISSRTPEGDPNQCPICGHRVWIEPSIGTRDAPCPSCGHLLWFAEHPSGSAIERAERGPYRQLALMRRVMGLATKKLGPAPEPMRAKFLRLGPSKFEKVDWEALFRARSWDEIEAAVDAANL